MDPDRMDPVVLALPGNEALAARVAVALGRRPHAVEVHRFPDGEARVRIPAPMTGKVAVVVCTLDRPDAKFLPLAFTLRAAWELGAGRVVLVAPYLCYMRQDRAFSAGEVSSASVVGNLLSGLADGIVTVDPHLHRIPRLDAIYRIPTRVVHAAPAMAAALAGAVPHPLLIGPDEESAQWVRAMAARLDAPFAALRKVRAGDREVEVSLADVARYPGRTPVLVDDILSTGRTLADAARQLRDAGAPAPVCAVVHPVFVEGAAEALAAAGITRVISTNTIPHATNAVDVAPLVAEAVSSLL